MPADPPSSDELAEDELAETETSKPLGPAGIIALTALVIFLVVAAWYAVHAWMALGAVAMDAVGWTMLILGSLITIAVGAGLMGLLFYSSRKNFDR